MSNNIKYGIIGGGYWGQILIKTLSEMGLKDKIVGFYDVSDAQIEGIDKFEHIDALINCVDAVFIATPPKTHFELVKKVLESGRDCWAEKPLTLSYDESYELYKIAKEKNKILHVDLTFLYNWEFSLIKSQLDISRFGKPRYANFVWSGNGKIQSCGSIWDLGPHVLSQVLSFFGYPKYVQGFHDTKNAAHFVLKYSNNFNVYCEVSWLSPFKVRKLELGSDSGLLVCNYGGAVNFMETNGKETLFKEIDSTSALEKQINHFNNAISDRQKTNENLSKQIMYIIEKIVLSADSCGREISV